MRAPWRCLLVVACCFVGCEWRSYELELTPGPKGLRRELETQIVTGDKNHRARPLPAAELEALAKAYAQARPHGDGPAHKFAGTFRDRQPNDVGGYGEYQEWKTEFGVARAYIERFRGDDDFVGSLDRGRERLGLATDLLVAWVDDAWANQPEQAALRRFVDEELRRDLENVLFLWQQARLSGRALTFPEADGGDPRVDLAAELSVRLASYLAERDYVDLKEAPRLFRIGLESEERRGPALLAACQTIVRRKLGLPADVPLPESLAIFADEARLRKSLNDSLRNSPEYQRKLAAWQQTPEAERANDPPEPLQTWSELLGEAFHFQALFDRDALTVKLHAETRPIATNGEWSAKRKVVWWSERIVGAGASPGGPPTYLYAVWATPDEAAQRAKFGEVVLAERALVEYSLWRNSLSATEASQWTRRLDSLDAAATARERVRAFRFEGEPEDPEAECLSKSLRRWFAPGP